MQKKITFALKGIALALGFYIFLKLGQITGFAMNQESAKATQDFLSVYIGVFLILVIIFIIYFVYKEHKQE